MLSRNGKEIVVGSKVLVLRTPVCSGHEFYEGVVTSITAKQVVVEGSGKQYKWTYSEHDHTFKYKRYPEQVIVI